MRHAWGIVPTILFIFLFVGSVAGQDVATLEKQFPKAAANQKADIANKLAELYLGKDGEKTIKWAKEALKHVGASNNSNRVKAEAMVLQAKAEAGIYYYNKTVPNRKNKSARQYHEAKNLYIKSMNLCKQIGYSQLELEVIENLAFLNTKKIGTHKADAREEEKYYKLYIERVKEIKKITTPTAVPVTIDGGGNSTNPSTNPSTSPSTSRLVRENKDLKEKVSKLTKEINEIQLELKKAAGASPEELEEILKNLEEKEQELSEITEAKVEAEGLVSKYKGEKVFLVKEKERMEELADQAKDKAELAELKNTRFQLGTILGSVIAALVLGFLFFAYRSQSRARRNLADKNAVIAEEQKRSEELLLNILPSNIAEELKEHGSAKARRHENVSVFFSDFKNFTKLSETLTPEELVLELDYCFKGLDFIISQYPSIEKIKTIGDAYMCCSGLNGKGSNPVADMAAAALDMQEFLYDYKADRQSKGAPFFEARIGIHTGPVVAGVVGNKKFAYDIWGDTVNVASRMESNGEVGKVNVSADTYDAIRYQFSCRPRGKINVKNKGYIEMYFVDKAYS
jgi:class 3 adenylate cyclase